jgi:NADPH:quinone reductase-like Zn-dependent oxidoreductase
MFFFFFSGVNFNDALGRYGLLEDIPRPPFVPGFECSGEVLDIGTNVTNVIVRSRSIFCF